MSDDVAVKVVGVSKSFKLPHEKSGSIKNALLGWRKRRRGYETQQVLGDVSFEIKKGEFFGIVGRNGSGKSTLLKLISQIYTPDKGRIQVNGKLTPFIELGVGFNPELSGRENVYLNGALLGFNHQEMDAMYDEIVEFAELERFMDQKLKNYSSGMQVRLAFSIAIRANSDILVLDEVLAVGDAAFQQKCFKYFAELKESHKTVILVTHDMGSVDRFCSRALLLESGEIKDIGTPSKIARQYTLDNFNRGNNNSGANSEKIGELSDLVASLGLRLLSDQVLSQTDNLQFEVSYKLKKTIDVDLGISIVHQNRSVIEHNTKHLKLGHDAGKNYRLTYTYALKDLNPGRYEVTVAIFRREGFELIGYNADACSFILDGESRGGLLAKRGRWTIND